MSCTMSRPTRPSPSARAPRRIALVLVAACAAVMPCEADQASSMFRVSIELLPERPGGCSASADGAAPQLTCRPTVVSTGMAAGAGGRTSDASRVAGYRLPDPAGLRLAGEMIEVGAENYYAWAEDVHFALGEYSSRLMVAGGVEYVEMTISW